jgi:signal transduction histidine kinase/CheY-like chemotaxis protein
VRRVFETGTPAISDFFVAPVSGLQVIALEVPVFNAGLVVYTLAAGISAGRLTEILQRQVLPADWVVAVFDSADTIAARTHAADRYVGGKASSSFLRGAGNISEGVVEANSLEGIPMLSAYHRSSRSRWAIGIGIPKATLTGNLWRSGGLYAAVTLTLLLLSLLMARAIGTRIGRSIQSLHAPAHSLGTNGLLSIPDNEIVEVNEVGRALMKASRMISERAIEREKSELATRQIIVAKNSADAASRAKSEFLASMSHELRTPLNAILGFAQLIYQYGNLTREKRIRYTENILEGGAQLGKIIDDLLDVARFEAGHVSVNLEVLDCLEVMTEASRALEVTARKRGLLFTVDTSGNLPSIVADRGRLIQILLNLGSNAIKYNLSDGWVLLTAVPRDGMVRFIVRDTGKGIPAERQSELFEPFNRLGNELTEEDGTGIGLTISRRLAEAMDGQIGFESTVGKGSEFWVELPVAAEAARTAVSRPPIATYATDRRCRVLYIEDKILNVELMRSIVEDFSNIQFLDTQSVEEGVRMACEVLPDLVITDIHLPDGKGYDVLRRLRNDPRTAKIPVVALTADAMPANVHNMQLAKFDDILTKPLKIPDLMKVLRARLKAA